MKKNFFGREAESQLTNNLSKQEPEEQGIGIGSLRSFKIKGQHESYNEED